MVFLVIILLKRNASHGQDAFLHPVPISALIPTSLVLNLCPKHRDDQCLSLAWLNAWRSYHSTCFCFPLRRSMPTISQPSPVLSAWFALTNHLSPPAQPVTGFAFPHCVHTLQAEWQGGIRSHRGRQLHAAQLSESWRALQGPIKDVHGDTGLIVTVQAQSWLETRSWATWPLKALSRAYYDFTWKKKNQSLILYYRSVIGNSKWSHWVQRPPWIGTIHRHSLKAKNMLDIVPKQRIRQSLCYDTGSSQGAEKLNSLSRWKKKHR